MASSKKPAASNLAAFLKQSLQAQLAPVQHLCVALSGGVDSVVLLHLLVELRPQLQFSLSAIHVNHQLSPHADAWASFCQRLCIEHGVPLKVRRVHVPRRSKLGLEGAARAARYQVFAEQDCEMLLLAHHLDDQAETLLQNLLRGSGVSGAAAMPALKHPPTGQIAPSILRPLLQIPRTTLLAYARKHRLSWVEDESNDNTEFARNFLRHNILPRIAQRYPAYRETLARAAANFAEADMLLSELASLDLTQAVRNEKLQIKALAQLSPARAMNALRTYLAQQGVPSLDRERVAEWLRQLLSARGDSQLRLDAGHLCLRRYRGEAWVECQQTLVSKDWSMDWQGEHHLLLPALNARLDFMPAQGSGISQQKLSQGRVMLRLRQGGEKLRISAKRPRRLLKHLLQEAGIPAWQRAMLPLLYCDAQLVAVPGVGIACEFQALPGEAGLQLRWQAT